jgi:hypothetical protein
LEIDASERGCDSLAMAGADKKSLDCGRSEQANQLIELIKSDPGIMQLLEAGRNIGLRKWCIAAGVIRNKVWDFLHGYQERTEPSDIDFLFYDGFNTEVAYEKKIEEQLGRRVPGVRWEAVNQATVHLYMKEANYHSIEEAMSRWAEAVTAVGVWLDRKNSLKVIAPQGLEDLFGLVVRPTLMTANAALVYRERIVQKRWMDRWPKLRIIWPDSSDL